MKKNTSSKATGNNLAPAPNEPRRSARNLNKSTKRPRQDWEIDEIASPAAEDKKDGDFFPGSETTFNPQNILHARTRHNTTTGTLSSPVALETSFLIRRSNFELNAPASPGTIHHAIMRQTMPASFRPIARLIFNEQQEIVGGETPDRGTILRVKRDYGALVQLSNEPATPESQKPERIESIDESHPFFQSESYRDVVKFCNSAKEIEIAVNKKSLQAVKDEKAATNKKRAKSMRSVMGVKGKKSAPSVSATRYISAVLNQEIEGEGAHNGADRFVGQPSMVPENMIYAPKAFNTDMLFIEVEVAGLAISDPKGVRLRCYTKLVPITKQDGTEEYLHMGLETHMNIFSEKFPFPGIHFVLDPQAYSNPHIVIKDYLNIFIHGLNEVIKHGNNPRSPLSITRGNHILYASDKKQPEHTKTKGLRK